jgi:FdhD protein
VMRILRWDTVSGPQSQADELAEEEPLEIQVDTRPICITMRTPGHDEELAAGFLLSEGLIHCREDISAIEPYWRNKTGNVLGVFTSPGVTVDFTRLTRHVFASSSCGLCGKASIEAVHQHFPPIRADISVSAEMLASLPDQLCRAQEVFQRTGGLHAAALFTSNGQMVVVREDVGRHNAVDKVLGYGLLKHLLPFNKHILMVSGRSSFEILQKALAAQIPIVAAVSAPSSLAVKFARCSGQTLVGFLRQGRMNVYSRADRICFAPQAAMDCRAATPEVVHEH